MLIVDLLPACAGTAAQASNALPVEASLVPGAEGLQRARLARRIRPHEDPVLPGGEPSEDPRLHRLAAAQPKIGFHAGERVRGKARAFLQRDADLVIPVELVGRG